MLTGWHVQVCKAMFINNFGSNAAGECVQVRCRTKAELPYEHMYSTRSIRVIIRLPIVGGIIADYDAPGQYSDQAYTAFEAIEYIYTSFSMTITSMGDIPRGQTLDAAGRRLTVSLELLRMLREVPSREAGSCTRACTPAMNYNT